MNPFKLTTFFTLTIAFALSGCTTLTVPEPLTQKHGGGDPEAQMEFWHALYESKLTSNDEAFHGFLLFIDGKDESVDYAARVESLKSRGLLAADFAGEPNAAATRGDLAVIVANMIKVKGGMMSTFFPHSPRYAMRELQYSGLFPPGSPWQSFTGGQFVSIIGRLEDYTRANPTDLPAKQLPDGEEPKKEDGPAQPDGGEKPVALSVKP